MRIGELARLSGASVRSLRYYEERGLLEAQRTSAGTHRVYESDAVDRVRLLRQLYSAGLSSETIASIMPCVDTPAMNATEDSIRIMRAEHDRLGEQIQSIVGTRDQLGYLIACADQSLVANSETEE